MNTYYAVCDAGGPISVRIEAANQRDAIAAFELLDHGALIDAARSDAEDDLDICGADMDEHEFDAALTQAGCVPVADLDPIVNAHAGTVGHLAGGWYLWRAGE
mgnify:CR=1 FL=1